MTRKKFHHFTPEEIEIIKQKLAEGMTTSSIAKDLNKTPSAIWKFCKRKGLRSTWTKPLTEEEKKIITQYLKDGLEVKEIVELTGKSAGQIYYQGHKIGMTFEGSVGIKQPWSEEAEKDFDEAWEANIGSKRRYFD